MKTKILGLLAVGLLAGPMAAQAAAVTVTFNEAGAPLGLLAGTTFYQSYGIANFQNASRFGPDVRLPDDGYGITNVGAPASVIFASGVSNLSFTWATSTRGVSFNANAFDASNNLLGSFFFNGASAPGSSNGIGSFAVGGIYRLAFFDGGASVAIDTLKYDVAPPVPLPAAAWLLLSGLAGLGFLGRRRKAA